MGRITPFPGHLERGETLLHAKAARVQSERVFYMGRETNPSAGAFRSESQSYWLRIVTQATSPTATCLLPHRRENQSAPNPALCPHPSPSVLPPLSLFPLSAAPLLPDTEQQRWQGGTSGPSKYPERAHPERNDPIADDIHGKHLEALRE